MTVHMTRFSLQFMYNGVLTEYCRWNLSEECAALKQIYLLMGLSNMKLGKDHSRMQEMAYGEESKCCIWSIHINIHHTQYIAQDEWNCLGEILSVSQWALSDSQL